MPNDAYARIVRDLSDRLVAAQKGIRILDAVKWDAGVREAFFASGCREQPPVDAGYYAQRPLGIDVGATRTALDRIASDLAVQLGSGDPAARLLTRMCREYALVLEMLESRGTPSFHACSRALYGSASERFHTDGPTNADLAQTLDEALRGIHASAFLEQDERTIPTDEAVRQLQGRLDAVFCEPDARVQVRSSDGIVADAAAGSDYIKLRKHALFSERDLRVLEAHEGWVHVGTTLNGRAQPWCTFLSKGTPSTTITQEGLALFVEVVSLRSHPARLRQVTDRIRAIELAERGASFLEIHRQLVQEGRSAEDAYATCARVFRGSTPTGAPFTKDLAYGKGFVQLYNFIRLAVRRGRLARVPLLFCGKVALADLAPLAELQAQAVLVPPRHLPPPLADLSAITAWMSYSSFLTRLDIAQVDADHARLLD